MRLLLRRLLLYLMSERIVARIRAGVGRSAFVAPSESGNQE